MRKHRRVEEGRQAGWGQRRGSRGGGASGILEIKSEQAFREEKAHSTSVGMWSVCSLEGGMLKGKEGLLGLGQLLVCTNKGFRGDPARQDPFELRSQEKNEE